MDSILYAVRAYLDLNGKPHLLEYHLLVEQGTPVRYGISIRERGGGCEQVRDLTTRRERAEQVLSLLAQGVASPVHLHDIVEDLIGAG